MAQFSFETRCLFLISAMSPRSLNALVSEVPCSQSDVFACLGQCWTPGSQANRSLPADAEESSVQKETRKFLTQVVSFLPSFFPT